MPVPSLHDYQLPGALSTEQAALWTFARVAEQRDLKALLLLQETVFQLAEKIKQVRELTLAENSFIKALFDNPWWGGSTFGLNQSLSWSGRPEALNVQGAQPKRGNDDDEKQIAVVSMLRHFFEGHGQLYAANLRCYQSSIVVMEVVAAFKKIIYERQVQKKPITRLSTQDGSFLNSKFGMDVESSRRSLNTRGYIFSDGTIMMEQKYTGLNNFKNRFVMEALTTKMGQMYNTQW